MKLIRWLFSNIILIAFVLALTYAYVYWDNLTGEDTPAGKLLAYLSSEYDEVREFLDEYGIGSGREVSVSENQSAQTEVEVKEPQVAMPPGQPFQPPVEPQQPAQPVIRQPVPPQAMRQSPPTAQYFRPEYRERQQPPVRQDPTARYPEQVMMPSAPQRPSSRPMLPEREPMSFESQTRPEVDAQGAPIQQPVSTPRDLWISAREEYHRGNIDVSIRNYKEVIATSPNNFDAYGELGNVYLSRGSQKEAAEAYFEAAVILVNMGQANRARSLLPMLSRLDRAKAEELNRLLSANRS